MTVTYIAGTSIGAGPLFTFGAAGDQLIIGPNGALSATSGDAIADVTFDNVSVTVLGTVAGTNEVRMAGAENVFHVGLGGSWISTEIQGGNAGIYMMGTTGDFRNDGTFAAQNSIGVLTHSGATVTNTGRIEAASAVWLGLIGGGASLVNSGSIIAGSAHDATYDTRFNNGVQVEHSAVIRNLAGGQITATATEGAGVNFYYGSGGSSLVNHGSITSMQDWGVDLSDVSAGQAEIKVFNAGVIAGADGSYRGSVNADSLANHGLLIGNVDMGDGADRFVNSGSVEGDVHLGSDVDVYDGSLGTASGTVYGDGDNDTFFVGTGVDSYDGGSGADYLDFGKTGATQMALDDSIDFSGSSAGDTYTGFEHVYGSAFDDVIYGSAGANLLVGRAGADTINGGAGGDTLRGGTGIDALTGGLGNDRFQYLALSDCGDTITDFHNVAGDDDAFYISAAKFGGGLVAGTLAANQFRSRADNLAQDADDRFIFRTTDKTLWYDADGNGAGAAIMVADLNADASLTNLDIVII